MHNHQKITNVLIAAFSVLYTATISVKAATITWAGYTWDVTTGGMAGSNTATASNVTIDTYGYLHLKITKTGTSWTCAELFTRDKLGFGTYRWQIDAPVDKFDKNVVLGLFPYGPINGIGKDGTNEIDIEYARWGNAAWPNGNYTVYPASDTTVGEITFNFSLNGTYTTSSFIWTNTSIKLTSQEGFKAVGDNSAIIKTWTYAPQNPDVNIPQKPVSLGMNLWLCNDCGGAPSDGKPVDVIIRSFQYIPDGTSAEVKRSRTVQSSRFAISQFYRSIKLQLDAPVHSDIAVHVSDSRGRILINARIPADNKELLLTGLCPGAYIVSIPDQGNIRNIVVTR
jgi:hypothetical protein